MKSAKVRGLLGWVCPLAVLAVILVVTNGAWGVRTDATTLRTTLGWTAVDEKRYKDISEEPCNYLYIDSAHGDIIYYGESQNCRTRLNQHFNAGVSAYGIIWHPGKYQASRRLEDEHSNSESRL